MPNNYFVEKRRQDKLKLLKFVKENPDMEDNKLVAVFSLNTGYRIETIKQMLAELREADVV